MDDTETDPAAQDNRILTSPFTFGPTSSLSLPLLAFMPDPTALHLFRQQYVPDQSNRYLELGVLLN